MATIVSAKYTFRYRDRQYIYVKALMYLQIFGGCWDYVLIRKWKTKQIILTVFSENLCSLYASKLSKLHYTKSVFDDQWLILFFYRSRGLLEVWIHSEMQHFRTRLERPIFFHITWMPHTKKEFISCAFVLTPWANCFGQK